jgi:gamma-glutamyltranspeptidase
MGGFASQSRAGAISLLPDNLHRPERPRDGIEFMYRDFHSPGRSAVMACEGMAATSHPLASEIAIATLRAGGTAADAAVTAVAALGVLEPHMTGIGGDCFCLVAKPGAPLWGYNGWGRSAAAARPDVLFAQGVAAIGFDSVHSVTVPLACRGRGAVAPEDSSSTARAPAIHHAERGWPLAPRVACDWGSLVERLRADPGAARHYLVDGRAPLPGDIMRFPALAATLKSIAASGPRAFYEDAAADIVDTLAARGSWLAHEDFARHRGEPATRSPGITAGRRGELPLGQAHRARNAQYSRIAYLASLDPDGLTACTSPSRPPGSPAARDAHVADLAICGSRRH